MSLINNSTRFCIFCYRNDNQFINLLSNTKNFSLFLKLVGRFNGDSNSKLENLMELQKLNELSMDHILGCCEGCLITVNGFCESYHKFKCLEMQLEWKIDKLVSIIKLANRVPSRVSKVVKALQTEHIEDKSDLTDQTENEKLKVVRKFRNRFTKQCHQRLKGCQPRVSLSTSLLYNAPSAEPIKAKEKSTDQLSHNDHQLAEPTPSIITVPDDDIEPIVSLDSLETISQSNIATNPETTLGPESSNDIGPDVDGDVFDESTIFEDTISDDDSISSHDFDDDPLNCDDICEDGTRVENDIAPVESSTNFISPSIPAEQEIQILEEIVTQVTPQNIPEPPSSLVINEVFSRLPATLSEILSKTIMCKICKKHFVSEYCLNQHIKKDHTETPSKKKNSTNLNCVKTEAMKDIIPQVAAPSLQKRYSLREKRSTVKYLPDSDNDNNDDEYTAGQNCPSSNTSDSEQDTKPIKPIQTYINSKSQSTWINVYYTNCKICNKKIMKKHLAQHLKTWHDKKGVEKPSQIIKCKNIDCKAYFLKIEQLNIHQRYEHATIFKCYVCQRTFSQKIDRNRHLRQAHNIHHTNPLKTLEQRKFKPTEFKCNFCNFVTISATKLALHETEHALPLPADEPSNLNMLRCPRCPYQYHKRVQRRYVVHHLKTHLSYLNGESSGACEMCSKGKTYVENTKQHYDRHHNIELLDDPTKVFKCDECTAYYLKSFQLHRHKIRIHPSKTCKICNKKLKTRLSLTGHMKMVHKGEESNPDLPVACDWPNCLKRFGTDGELEFHKIYSHKRNPEGKKYSVVCEICGKGFSSDVRLKFHMERVHVEKNWVCNECGKSFKCKKYFETHLDYHNGPETWKFECKECGKKCMNKWKLESHMNTHTKEKPYICQFCGEKYAHRHNWRNHLKGKHLEEEGVEEIVNVRKGTRKGNYLSRKGTKKGDCIMSAGVN